MNRLEITEMSREECDELLGEEWLGRIAFSFHDRVDVQPIGYVYRGGWLFGRTSTGNKLTTIRHNRWVAFQVDRVRDLWNWESVVVRGAVHLLGGDGPEYEELRAEAARALSDAFPGTFESSDPAPHRSIPFAVSPQEVVGRRATLVERS